MRSNVPIDSPNRPTAGRRIAVGLLRGGALLLVGLALLAALVTHSGVDQIHSVLAGADRTLLATAGLLIIAQSFTLGLRWWLALRLCGHEGRFVSLLRASAMSHVINFTAPGHFGEPVTAVWLERTGRAPGVESFALLVVTKAAATLLNLVLVLACLLPLAANVNADGLPQIALMAGLALVLMTLAFVAVLHPSVATWGSKLLGRLTRTLLGPFDRKGVQERTRSARMGRSVEAFCGRFRASFVLLARRPAALAATTAVSALKLVCLVVATWLIYAALGAAVSPAGATFVTLADAAGNMAAVWIPANLGVQEVVHSSASAGALGLGSTLAVAAALVVKGLMVVHAAFGALIWLALAPLDPVEEPQRIPDGVLAA